MPSHPAQRFQAPSSIQHGTPLKEVLGPDLIKLVGESFADILPEFDRRRFERAANAGLDALEFNQRGQHIGRALGQQLPLPFSKTCQVLLAAFGPELTATEGNGLAPFFYMPHAHVISELGIHDVEHGLRANYELTKRMTAEFSIRPFLVKHRDHCLRQLAEWASDPSPHVRRLVTEGTRPRLPWAMRLKEFQQDPTFTLPLLELLKDDEELYVRRSVANHLADILKDHPDIALATCERWVDEASTKTLPAHVAKGRRWIVRHAVRLPAKKGDARANAIREAAK